MQTKHHLADMLEPIIEKLGYETVRIMTIGQTNPTLQIMIDKTDGTEITVDDCAKVSRALSEILDEKDPIADKYNLEVSSPGLDRPLTKPAHFQKFAGNEVKIETDELVDGRKRFKGVLKGIEGSDVLLTMDETVYQIPFDAIAKAKIILTDELLARWEAEHPQTEE
ncbi:MAG: ribosome maturation factor RimP [Alphaproteobacteria bacterium]|nr:ribosome maturation factor RimP [Alphaproteobacteria bacterium]